jgi:hypothetical protein
VLSGGNRLRQRRRRGRFVTVDRPSAVDVLRVLPLSLSRVVEMMIASRVSSDGSLAGLRSAGSRQMLPPAF